jgi:hypothetical protein
MAHKTKPLPYKEFAEHIDEHLDALTEPGSEVTFERDGCLYEVVRMNEVEDDDIWKGYDPERLRRTIRSHRYNALAGLDVEAFKQYLKETRGQDSEGRPA